MFQSLAECFDVQKSLEAHTKTRTQECPTTTATPHTGLHLRLCGRLKQLVPILTAHAQECRGGGISGTSACQVAVGVGANVTILDINPTRLRYVHDILEGHVTTVMSNQPNIEEEVLEADLQVSGRSAATPVLLSPANRQ